MSRSFSHGRIYKYIVDILESSPLPRGGLIERTLGRLKLTPEELADMTAGSTQSNLRSRIGALINEMHSRKLIGLDDFGKYYLISDRPVVIRIERCEREIVKALTEREHSKAELRSRLKSVIGTDKTATTRDDDTLSTYVGQILKRMLADGTVMMTEGVYKLSPALSAKASDINEMMALKGDFLQKLHSKGGEFFENYFMTLLSKYAKLHGKKVLECYVTGGSADGGIDGVMKTEDSFGFRETVMVQTKNRVDISSETDVRGFYGAVCAKRGTRGMFVTTSDFHPAAIQFLGDLDDCVGVNGEKVFSMATECSYGIKKHEGKLIIDNKILT